jgi:hypothetical protein
MQLLSYLEELVEIFQMTKPRLNEVEFFVLEASAWLHDIGYILPPAKRHAANSQTLIRKLGKKYFNLGKAERIVLSWVCKAHSRRFPLEKVPVTQRLHGEVVRSRELAALFAFADACDVQGKRAPEIVFQILKKELTSRYPKSVPHWKGNQSTEGVYLSSGEGVVYLNVLSYTYTHRIKHELEAELVRCLSVLGDSFLLREVRYLRLSEPP